MGVLATLVSLRTPLWRDEIATLSFAELPLADLIRGVSHVDGVMLPYYLISHLTQVVVPGAFSLRLPSVIAITTATAATAALVGRWWGPAAAAAAGLALALNPLAIQQGATARPYALAICFVALAALALAQALSPRAETSGWSSRAPWIGYAACLALAGLMHLFTLLCVPAFLILAAVARRLGPWLVATAVGGVAVLPLMLFAFGQRGQVDWIQQPTLRSGLGALASLVTFRGDSAFGPLEAGVLGLIAVLSMAAILLVLHLPKADRVREGGRVAFALASLGGPWLLLLAISVAWTPYLRTTYLTPSLVGFCVLVGAVAGLGASWASGSERNRRLRGAAVVALVLAPVALAAGMSLNVVTRAWYIDDLPGLGAALTGAARPGDVLAVVQLNNEVGVASGVARVIGDSGYTADLQAQLVAGEQPRLGLRRIIALEPVRTEPIDRVPATGEVWVVYTRGAISAEEFSKASQSSLGCTAVDLADVGSFGILRLANGGCTR